MSNRKNGTIYIWVTSNLLKRVYEHKQADIDGFTKKYKLHHLVFFEHFETTDEAMQCEKK